MTVATDLRARGTVSYTVRFAANVDLNLMDIVRSLINTGGPMGVSVEKVGAGLVFDVYVPRDLTGIAFFSKFLGNLTSVDLSVADPTDTVALVRGSATFVERDSAVLTTWNRAEMYTDATSTSVAAEINQAGDDVLAQSVIAPQLSGVATDLPRLAFGQDYGLGDKVTVEIAPGDTYADIISQVDLIVNPQAQIPVQAIPTIGVPAAIGNADPSVLRQLAARIRRIERRLNTV
jgi:hypothetical protein